MLRVCEHGGFNEAIDDGVWGGSVTCRRPGGRSTGPRCRTESHDELSALSCGVYRLHAEGTNANGSRRMPCNRAGVHCCLYQLTETVNDCRTNSPVRQLRTNCQKLQRKDAASGIMGFPQCNSPARLETPARMASFPSFARKGE
jgi:hypothetical protein